MSGISPGRKLATELRRGSILHAARAVFARQGYANTVVDDIASEAGIAKGTLYLYFPSKEQIYLAALLEEARRLDADSRAAMSSASTWRDKLGAYLQVRLDYFDAHQDFLRIYMTEFRGMCMQGKALTAEFSHLVQEGEAQLAQMFAAAVGAGRDSPGGPGTGGTHRFRYDPRPDGTTSAHLGPSGRGRRMPPSPSTCSAAPFR